MGLNYGNGIVIVNDGTEDFIYSRHLACLNCGISYRELAPNSFSFNSPYGSCPDCEGLGEKKELDLNLIIPDWEKSINEEGLAPLGKPRQIWFFNQLNVIAEKYGFTFDTKLKDLTEEQKDILLNGSKEKIPFSYSYGGGKPVTYMHKFAGMYSYLKNYYNTTTSNNVREWVESFMNTVACPTCGGGRLKQESLSVKFQGKNISEVTKLSIFRSLDFFNKLKISGREGLIAKPIIKEITTRLSFLLNVGLDYLTLDRSARTLSGGSRRESDSLLRLAPSLPEFYMSLTNPV